MFICEECLPEGEDFGLHLIRSHGPCEHCGRTGLCADCQHLRPPTPREALSGAMRSSLALAAVVQHDAELVTQLEELDDTVTRVNGKPLYLGLAGEPIGLQTWVRIYSDFELRCLARDRAGDAEVITAWHGLCSFEYMHDLSTNSGIFGSIIKTADGGFRDEIETGSAADALMAHKQLLQSLL